MKKFLRKILELLEDLSESCLSLCGGVLGFAPPATSGDGGKGGTQTPRPVYGPTNPSPEEFDRMEVKRFAAVIGLVPEKEQYYRELHAEVWPGVLKRLRDSNIRNYSIYIAEIEGKKYLFSYFEYTGRDFQSDMEKIKQDPTTQRWWRETEPCQFELPNRKPGEHWTSLEMVFLMEK